MYKEKWLDFSFKKTAVNSGLSAAPEYRLGLRHIFAPRVRYAKTSPSRGTLCAILLEFMMITRNISPILNHYSKYFGESVILLNNPYNKKTYLENDFTVLCYEPNEERSNWIYATCGLSLKNSDNPIEIFVYTPSLSEIIIDILSAVADYHITGEKLGLNHTVYFGIPWASDSICSYGLLSYPYLESEAFYKHEKLETSFLWMIPITEQEREYKIKFGVEKLEKQFEEKELNYTDYKRKSIV